MTGASQSNPAEVVRSMFEQLFSEGPQVLESHPGMHALRDAFPAFKTAFPDLSAEFQQQIVEGNRVASHWILRGTHRGSLFGIAPTGKTVQFQNVSIAHVADGRVVKYNSETGWLACLKQIGALPMSQGTPAKD